MTARVVSLKTMKLSEEDRESPVMPSTEQRCPDTHVLSCESGLGPITERLPASDPSADFIASQRELPDNTSGRNSRSTSATIFHTEYRGCVFCDAPAANYLRRELVQLIC